MGGSCEMDLQHAKIEIRGQYIQWESYDLNMHVDHKEGTECYHDDALALDLAHIDLRSTDYRILLGMT